MNREVITQTLRRPVVFVSAASVVSASAGAILGFHVAKRKLESKYSLIADQEIAEAKRYYSEARVVQPEKPSPQEVLAESIIEEQGYSGKPSSERLAEPPFIPGDAVVTQDGTFLINKEGDDSTPETLIDDTDEETAAALQEDIEGRQRQNVFEGRGAGEAAEDEWDYEAELRIRAENPDKPYIIHHDEFYENETDYEQATLTYYEGDDTLADEKDVPVPDEDSVVGEDALVAFGHGSKDKNVVFVRNDKLELDFEIVKSNGKYSVEVLGLDDTENELRHSYTRHPNRQRHWEDDD